MRFPSIAELIRISHIITRTTGHLLRFRPASTLRYANYNPRLPIYRSMPNIPFLGALFGSQKVMSDSTNYPVTKPEGEWQAQLSPEQFRVLREAHTERAGTGQYDKHYPEAGVYRCAGCDAKLYEANTKFDSGCGWPAFWDAVEGAVGQREDNTIGMSRTEIVCNNCGGHLGHIFKGERFGNPKNERHCVNSISLNFEGKDGQKQ